ncbi:MAG: Fe-S cluster assembly protein SufB, partial [Planctomycetota bacterium]
MSEAKELQEFADKEYEFGFVTDVESDAISPGLDEETIREISQLKGEPDWLLEFRLKSYRHWITMTDPSWGKVDRNAIDYQKIIYYSAPKPKKELDSLDEVDPELLKTFEKLGISLDEQKR